MISLRTVTSLSGALLAAAMLAGCATSPPEESAAPETATTTPQPAGLAGTSWRLVRFAGSDDTVLTPDDPSKYTVAFDAQGNVGVRIDCNRGRGTWRSSEPSALEFGPLAMTRAMCPQAALTDRVTRDWSYVRSFVLKNGHLYLSLMADGGIYEFEAAE